MGCTPRIVRIGIVLALAIPAALLFLGGRLQAQIPRPGMPPRPQIPKFPAPPAPNIPTPRPPSFPEPYRPTVPPLPSLPRYEYVWVCSGCNKELGKATGTPPANCPYCKVRLINGAGGGSPNYNALPPRQSPPPPVDVPQSAPPVPPYDPITTPTHSSAAPKSPAFDPFANSLPSNPVAAPAESKASSGMGKAVAIGLGIITLLMLATGAIVFLILRR